MKDSGVEWIGEIPSKWQIKKLKYILNERKEKNDPIVTDNILSLSVDKGVFPYSEKTGGGNKAKEDLTAYKIARKKDIVINSMNILAGAVGLSKYEGAVSPVYYTLYSNKSEVLIEYFYYLFLTTEFQKSLLGLGNGIMMKESSTGKLNTIRMRIPMEKLNSLLLPLPSIQVQYTIIERLQDDVKWINKIIVDTKQSIEELNKYKQSLITEVVTKGLDKNVEMKDSGIEWIGEFPKDWEVIKTKYRYKTSKGLTITKDNLQDEGIPVLNYGEIHSKYPVRFNPLLNPVKFVSEDFIVNKNALLKYGDLIFADTSEDIEGSGNFTCFLGEGLCFAGYHTVVLKPTLPMNPIFMSYLFDSLTFRKQVRNLVQGIKVYSITQNILRNTYIWLPPLEEQDKIAMYLESKIKFIDNLVNEKQKVINEYKSYKKSLIYEYVTGKKEVGEEVK